MEELTERISKADGVFFTGGDQLKLTSIYGWTEFMVSIKQKYVREGLIIGGTSAGAMAMATPMIFDGTGSDEMVAAGVKITTGFEFLKDVCIDTHFAHRGRFVRMAQVIATNPASIGIGIEEDTAMIISEGTKAKVVGNGVVIVIDGEKSTGSNIVSFNNDKKITIRDLSVSILSADETFVIPMRNPSHL
jgi:cyanophycinase